MCIPAIAAAGASIGSMLGGTAAGVSASAAGGLATAMQIGGGVLGAVSQVMNYQAQAKAAKRSAAVAQEAARETLEQGEQESDLQRRAAAKLMGQQKVGMAANGIDLNSTNAIDLLDETALLSEEDAFAIRTNAQRQAKSLSQQAANYRADAASAKSAAFFEPVKTILGTGAKVGSRYSHYAAGYT